MSGAQSDDALYNALADALANGESVADVLGVLHDFLRDLRDETVKVELTQEEKEDVESGLAALEAWSSGSEADPEGDDDEPEGDDA